MQKKSKRYIDSIDCRHLPPIGQRIIKTSVAVFICLLIYALRGYEGQDMRAESAIAAIICMQPYISTTRQYALNRLAGSFIGAGWGLLLLFLLYTFPVLGANRIILFLLMSCGVMLSLYTSVLIHKTDSSALSAIIFLWLVISFPDIESPLLLAANRILDLLIGILAAIAVNAFHLPRTRNPQYVFFVRSKDLIPDRFSQVSPSVLFRLNALHNNGAKICLISEHAPAFFTLQMNAVNPNIPLIVMDGAAIYNISENAYMHTETISIRDSSFMIGRLNAENISFFIYTVHRNRTCIFHHGDLRPEEQQVYDRMRSSPYRSYMDEEIFNTEEIVYLKIIFKNDRIHVMENQLKKILPKTLRYVRRPQAGSEEVSALYIYSSEATVENARTRLMKQLRAGEPGLVSEEIVSRTGYRSELDALRLLHTIETLYEPVSFFRKHPQKRKRKKI